MNVYINRYLMMIVSCVMMLSSCSNNNDLDGEQTGTVPLQLLLLDNSTRSAITSTTLPEGSNYGVFVVDAKSLSPLSNGNNVSVNYNNGNSRISSNILLSSSSECVYAYYPYSSSQSLTSFNIETESQTDYLYGTSVDANGSISYVNAQNPKAMIKFNHAMARLTFNITQDASDTESNVITQIKIGTVPTAYTYNFMTNSMTLKSSGEVSAACKIAPSASAQSVDMLVLPISNYNMTVSFYINNKWVTTSLTGVNWTMGQQYTYSVVLGEDKISISQPIITPRVSNTENGLNVSGKINNNVAIGGTIGNAVDLGLSVKWADHNIGATNPEDYGGYYGWGDPTGMLTSTNSSDYPTINNIQGSQYDIANVQWNGAWRLPTEDEFKELCNNCTMEWTTRNGIKGMLFTSKILGYTNQSVFFPACGERDGNNVVGKGSYGYYWAERCFQSTDNIIYATMLLLGAPNANITNPWNFCSKRFYGHAVRPVVF